MAIIKLTLKARRDLEAIEGFIQVDNPDRARTYTKELLERFIDTVGLFPMSCPQYSKRKHLRRFVYGEYNVYYSYNKSQEFVDILHIFHRSQLVNSIFLD